MDERRSSTEGGIKKKKLGQKITRKVMLNVNKQDTSIRLYNGCDEETTDTLVSTMSYFHWFVLGNTNKWLANKWFTNVIARFRKNE